MVGKTPDRPLRRGFSPRCRTAFSAAVRRAGLAMLLIPLAVTVFAVPADDDFARVTGPCRLTFPADHGAHPDYRTEWWYYTGNLTDDTNRRFGFQLTFFRSRILSPGEERSWPPVRSAWRTGHVYMAHAALSDIDGNHFRHSQKLARGAVGLAGAVHTHRQLQVFIGDWFARIAPEHHDLKASTPQFGLALRAIPAKPPVLHGDQGYSRKGSAPDRASCYYSFTRMDTRGTLQVEDKTLRVTGSAWMDHEFSSAPLDPDAVGWDWFSLQLDDETELMVFVIREKDGRDSSASSGTFVDSQGQVRHLTRSAFTLERLATWTSPHSKARYPSRWRLRVPALDLDLTVAPNLDDQELQTGPTTGVTYWEGSVQVNGTRAGSPVAGHGYVELTGYAGPFDAPL